MPQYILLLPETSHGQFHVIDADAFPDPSEVWTEETCANRIAVTDGFVGIGVLQDNPEVEVTLSVGQPCTAEEVAAWDHVVAGSLEIRSGRLEVSPCIPMSDDEVHTIPLEPGSYRLCVLCDWFDTAQQDASSQRRERYKIFLWPAPYQPVEIIKRRCWDSVKRGWGAVEIFDF